MHTNYVPNPSMESVVSTVDLHRNLIKDPDLLNLALWTSTAGTNALVSGNRMQFNGLLGGSARIGATHTLDTKKVAGTYVLSVDLQTAEATATSARVILLDTTGSVIRATTTLPKVAGGGNNRYDFTLTPTGDWDRIYIEFTGTAIPQTATAFMGRPIIGQRSVVVPFFSPGQGAWNADLVAVWAGTANASESILRGNRASGVNTATSNALVYQSSAWADTGTHSVKVDPTGGVNASYGSVVVSGLTAGETYTAIAKIRLDTPQTGSLHATWVRQLMAQSTGMVINNVLSNRAPNTVGVHELRVTFTLGASTTVTLFMMNGSLSTPTWFDSFAIVDGVYAGAYFDGSTAPVDGLEFRWDGTANASTSSMFIPAGPGENTYYCDINWFQDQDDACTAGIIRALEEEQPYESQYIPDEAPWFSRFSGYTYPRDPSYKFLGVYGLSVSALSDSTRTVGITEGILSGGVLSRERLAVPRFRFRVMLTATDEEGLEYGKAWLSKALSEQACGTHGPSCGSSDITFFARCPAFQRDFQGPVQAYNEKVDLISRVYHDVKCIAGPITVDEFNRGANGWGAIVEFELAAGVPTMFGLLNPFIPISQDGETVINDVPVNEIKFPSAEIAQEPSGMNANPSLEVNTVGWSGVVAANSGTNPNPYWTLVRSSESAFQGTYSFRGLIQGVSTGSNLDGIAKATLQTEIDATALAVGAPIMASAYGRFGTYTGELSDAHLMQGFATWKTAANVNVGAPIPMGTVDAEPALSSWQSFSAVTLKPATATKLIIEIQYTFLWNTGPLGVPSRIPIFMDLADSGPILPVSTNYSTNPSVETNATGWNFSAGGAATGVTTAGRVTGELAAAGTSSYRTVITATAASATLGIVEMWQDVDISTRPAGAGVSFTIWTAQALVSGTATRANPIISYAWLDAASVQIGSTVIYANVPVTGGVVAAKSLTPPAGAARLRVKVVNNISAWSATAVIRMYVDALAVTVP